MIGVKGAYKIDASTVDAAVVFVDKNGKEQSTTVKGISFDKTSGTCEIKIRDQEDISIRSITLYKGGVPFEWLDYSKPVAVSGGKLDLDVADNEFANGSYVNDSTVMEVANPRHLDNIRKHLGGSFKQTKDIDFESSCGIDVEIDADTSTDIISIAHTRKDIDKTSRFYGGSSNSCGWQPIGSTAGGDIYASDAFTGTYDGNGKVISGLISDNINNDAGSSLFAGLKGATVKNVTLDDSCIFASDKVAAGIASIITGDANDPSLVTSIENCSSSAVVYGYSSGGIVSETYEQNAVTSISLNISDCQIEGKIYGEYAGGIICRCANANASITGCNVTEDSELTAASSLGGLVCSAGNVNCENDSLALTDCQMSGALFVSNTLLTEKHGNGCIIGETGLRLLKDDGTFNLTLDNVEVTDKCSTSFVEPQGRYELCFGGIIGKVITSYQAGGQETVIADKQTLYEFLLNSGITPPAALPGITENRSDHKIGNYVGSPWIDEIPCKKITLAFENGYPVSINAVSYTVQMFDDENNEIIDPLTVDLVNGFVPDVAIDDVPLNLSRLFVNYNNSNGYPVGGTVLEKSALPKLSSGGEYTIDVNSFGSEYPVNITNAYSIDADKVDVKVMFSDGNSSYKSYFKDIPFDKDTGSLSVDLKCTSNPSVSSIIMYSDGIPFEWIDYSSPVSPSGGVINIDVEDNEFANGRYVDDTTVMEVANPRHLDNIRNHLGGTFKQTKDIDFGKSNGFTNSITYDRKDTETTFHVEKILSFDDSMAVPRFYHTETEYGNIYGFVPIGDESSRFSGSYDGDGHVISNLVINYMDGDDSHSVAALFGFVDVPASHPVSNVIMDDSCSFASTYLSASIAGDVRGELIVEGCSSEATIYSAQYAAGFVTQIHDDYRTTATARIRNCSYNGFVGGKWISGIFGYISYGTVECDNCEVGSDTTIVAFENFGGLIYYAGINSDANVYINNCKISGTMIVPHNSKFSAISGAVIGDSRAGTVRFEGTTVINCRMEYTLMENVIGGVIGRSDLSKDDLIRIMKGHISLDAAVMSEISEDRNIGHYCGSPFIDSIATE